MSKKKTCELNVAGRLTIWGAEDLKALLAGAVADEKTVRITMADKDEFDVAGIQLLLAAQKSFGQGSNFAISDPSDDMATRLRQIGLEIADGKVRSPNAR